MLRVNGGPARSGVKLPLRDQRPDWTCSQGHANRGWCIRCITSGCNEKRP